MITSIRSSFDITLPLSLLFMFVTTLQVRASQGKSSILMSFPIARAVKVRSHLMSWPSSAKTSRTLRENAPPVHSVDSKSKCPMA